MKTILSHLVLAASIFILTSTGKASEELNVDGLGNYADTLKNIKETSGVKEVRVIQDRLVSRKFRNEFSIGYNNFLSGNPYLLTQTLNLGYNFSFNRFVSVGVSYFTARNGLSQEGRNLINNDIPDRVPNSQRILPTVDSIKGGYEASVQLSPFYGKVNMFDYIAHFDIYALAGIGQMQMTSGNRQTLSYGAGLAFWWSNHWNTRVEFKNLQYRTESIAGSSNITSSVAGLSLGYML